MGGWGGLEDGGFLCGRIDDSSCTVRMVTGDIVGVLPRT